MPATKVPCPRPVLVDAGVDDRDRRHLLTRCRLIAPERLDAGRRRPDVLRRVADGPAQLHPCVVRHGQAGDLGEVVHLLRLELHGDRADEPQLPNESLAVAAVVLMVVRVLERLVRAPDAAVGLDDHLHKRLGLLLSLRQQDRVDVRGRVEPELTLLIVPRAGGERSSDDEHCTERSDEAASALTPERVRPGVSAPVPCSPESTRTVLASG
jgi:hypothetical protein